LDNKEAETMSVIDRYGNGVNVREQNYYAIGLVFNKTLDLVLVQNIHNA